MADVIKGSDCVVWLYVTDLYIPIFCADSMQLRIQQEVINKTSNNSGKYREKTTRLVEWSVNVNGLTKIQNGSEVAWFYLAQDDVFQEEQQIKISFTDDDATVKNITGKVIIPQLQITASPDDFANASVNFEGSGAYTIDSTEDVTIGDNMGVVRYTATGGESSFTDVLLDGVTVLLGFRETDEYNIITSGTPGNQQLKFDSATKTISWDSTNPANAGERFTILFKS